jgi:hypothetical protein
MSTTPAKEIERNRDEPEVRDHACVTSANYTCHDKEVCCFASGGGT